MATSITLKVTGLCPLFFLPPAAGTTTTPKVVFGIFRDDRHRTSLKVNGAELGNCLVGPATLSLKKGNTSKQGVSFETTNSDPTKPSDSICHFADLERIHKKPLDKDYSHLKGYLMVDTGKLYTSELVYQFMESSPRNKEPKPLKYQRVAGKTREIQGPGLVAQEIGLYIELTGDEEVELGFDNGVTLIMRVNPTEDKKYEIELDNSCSSGDSKCPGTNDFSLIYKMITLSSENPFEVTEGKEDPFPRICIPAAFGKTNPDDVVNSF